MPQLNKCTYPRITVEQQRQLKINYFDKVLSEHAHKITYELQAASKYSPQNTPTKSHSPLSCMSRQQRFDFQEKKNNKPYQEQQEIQQKSKHGNCVYLQNQSTQVGAIRRELFYQQKKEKKCNKQKALTCAPYIMEENNGEIVQEKKKGKKQKNIKENKDKNTQENVIQDVTMRMKNTISNCKLNNSGEKTNRIKNKSINDEYKIQRPSVSHYNAQQQRKPRKWDKKYAQNTNTLRSNYTIQSKQSIKSNQYYRRPKMNIEENYFPFKIVPHFIPEKIEQQRCKNRPSALKSIRSISKSKQYLQVTSANKELF